MQFSKDLIDIEISKIGKISKSARIGEDGNHRNVLIEFPIFIGDNVRVDAGYIGAYTSINERTVIRGVKSIGRYCSIAPGCIIGAPDHPLYAITSADPYYAKTKWDNQCLDSKILDRNSQFVSSMPEIKKAQIKIGNDVWIGQNVIIKRGICIGDGAVIGAGAVVVKDVEPYEIVGGVPAKHIKYRFAKSVIEKLCDLKWWNYEPKYVGENYAYTVDEDYVKYMETIKNKYETFMPQRYIFCDLKKQIIKEKDNLPYCGTISNENKILYYNNQRILNFHGWLVPEKYDKIEVIADNQKIGDCIIGIKRSDVYRNYPEYMSEYGGFSANLYCRNKPNKVILNIYWQSKIVHSITSQNIIEFSEYKQNIMKEEGQIDYYNLVNFAKSSKTNVGVIIDEIKKDRKLLCCYGNCQILSINSLILTSDKIRDKYFLINLPPIQQLKDEECIHGLDENILSKIDLFIYQNVKRYNKFGEKLSTNYILSLLKKECISICIPNCFFTGYFPQYVANCYNPVAESGKDPFPYGDKNIQLMWENMTVKEIQNAIADENFYSVEEVAINAEQSLQELQKREKLCDVIISDYIQKFYKIKYLFFTPNHVSNILLKELLVRTFRIVGVDCNDIKEKEAWENSIREMLIYPSVKIKLGLKFDKDKFAWNRVVNNEESTLHEYIEAYVNYCKPEWEKQRRENNEILT